jgi:hypothetical protein
VNIFKVHHTCNLHYIYCDHKGFLGNTPYTAAAWAGLTPRRSRFLTVVSRADARDTTIRNDNRCGEGDFFPSMARIDEAAFV